MASGPCPVTPVTPQESRRKTPMLVELRTDSMESQCAPGRLRRLESIISGGESTHDFTQDILQLLLRLQTVHLNHGGELGPAFADLQTLWKISRQGVLGNLRAVLADLITEEENVLVFQNTLQCVSDVDGYFNHDKAELWKCVKHVLCVMWNCSDVSPKLCRKICECGILTTCVRLLTDITRAGDFVAEDKRHFLVKAFLGLLHNCVRNNPECKSVLQQESCLSFLPSLFGIASPMVKAKSLMITSYLVSEQENNVLSSSDETILFIVQVLAESSKSRNHVSAKYGMSTLEILRGLNNIAMNDGNKVRIVSGGGLKLYAMLLLSEDEDERETAALGVWTLAFASENKPRIIQEPGLVEGLRALTKAGNNTSSAHHARGALWELFHGQEKVEMSVVDSSVPHVMISYQWEAQKVMTRVKDTLNQAGFKVWMDVEHMTGSTLEAMALAVERAAVVLICMSDKYKASPSCRTESEYIFRLHKDIVPLRLQSSYRPDGWLGILVGTRLYFDFSNEELTQRNLPKVIKELGHRGKIHVPSSSRPANGDTPEAPATAAAAPPLERRESQRGRTSKLLSQASRDSSRDSTRESAVEQWSGAEVTKWLTDHKLAHLSDRFSAIDGPLLLEMRRVRKAAPEFFYRTLQQDLHMDLATGLRFSQLLGRLV